MRIISRAKLKGFARGKGDAEKALDSWYWEAKAAGWRNPADVKKQFGAASFVGERVVFNICGNKYRMVCFIDYRFFTVYIRWIGTHKEYDKIDIETV